MSDSDVESTDFVSLRQLKYWLVVVKEGSVTAASRRLAISQPALSQHLRALERRLGGALLERLPRGVQLTPLGRDLMQDAQRALATASRLDRLAKDLHGLDAGTLEIAALPSLVDSTLLEPLGRWHEERAQVTVRLHEYPRADALVQAVLGGTGDIAVSTRPPRWRGPLRHLGWEQFVVMLPPGDERAASADPVNLNDLRDRHWVLYDRANGLADFVEIVFAHAGFRPRQAVLTTQVQAAARLSAAKLGPALLPSHNVPASLARLARPLNPPVVWELTAFARSEFSPAAESFIELLSAQRWIKRPDDAIQLPQQA